MKTWIALSVVSLALVWPAVALAQDSVTVAPTHYKVVFENPSVRVLRIDYAPGTKSAMHQHPDSIVIPLTPSKVRFATPDGKSTDSELASESATYMPAGTHSPSNVGAGRVDALLVEFKSAAPGKAALPTSRPGMMSKALAEGPRAIAYRSTADPTFQEPAGSKHEYDQVVIALGAGQMSLAIDGKPAKTTWTRGDAVFVERGVAHESKNASGKPVDFIIVAIK
jgi:quercetin dioxygenase-like cupin family protein